MLGPLRDVSIIFLVIPVMLCLLIPLALTIGMAYLLVRTRRFLPPKFRLVRLQAQRVNAAVDRAGAKVTSSLAAAEAKSTQTGTLIRNLFHPSEKDRS